MPKTIEPDVDLAERVGIDRVQAPRPLGPYRREPAVSQHLEMLRNGRLGNPELVADDGAYRTGGQLVVGEQLEDPAAHRVAEYIERVHVADDIRYCLYKPYLKTGRTLASAASTLDS